MLDFLFYLCIDPLESAMRATLFAAHAFTGSWGVSLVILSIAVNIALIPVYHVAETWQEAERFVQRRMGPKLAEIQSVFSGRERYMYTRALYRLHGYSPAYALRTSFGLLIQIPFFFAAYHLLNAAPELAGQRWLFLQDLAKPDGLLGLGGLQVNLLPFVMTGANILSAAVYASRLTKREKVQLYGLAVVFLLLLYPSSAALLVYWTCNNLFSFGKNIVYTRFLYSRMTAASDNAQAAAATDPESSRVSALYDAIPALLAGAAFALAVILRKRTGLSPAILALIIASAALAGTGLVLRLRALRRGVDKKREHSQWFGVFSMVIAVVVALCVWKLTSFKKIADPQSWLFFRTYAATIGLLVGWATAQRPLQPIFCRVAAFAQKKISTRDAGNLFAASALVLAILVCWHAPTTLYASDPDFFYEPFAALLGRLTFRGLVFLAAAALIFHQTKNALRPFMALVFAWTAICALLFTFAAAGDYGAMDEFILQDPALLKTRLAPLVDLSVACLAGGVLLLALRRNKIASLTALLQGVAFALCLAAAYEGTTAPTTENASPQEAATRLPDYNDDLFGFSRNGENTLVVMLDMFTGGHMERILAEAPELRRDLDGFVWFPDTVSPGATTLLSIGALLGGEAYAPPAVNARRSAPLKNELHKAFATLPDIYVPRGYSVALADVDELTPSLFEKFCPAAPQTLLVGKSITTAYTGLWREKHGLPSPLPETRAPFMASVGLFRAAPWTLRNHIYYDGSWLNTQTVIHNPSEGPYAMLDLLPEVSNANAPANTLKYITSQVAHYPWRLDEAACMPVERKGGYSVGKDRVIKEHVVNERCGLQALVRWFRWMKENGVYDNTQIILVSDHDGNDSASFGKEFDDLRPGNTPWKPDALLLVKQRGGRGELRIDDRPMSGADVVPLICASAGPCPGIDSVDPLRDQAEPRVRTHSAGLASIRRHGKDHFKTKDYRIVGSMFNRNNWSVLEKDE